MKKNNKHKFLEHLKTIPIVQVACEKSGISRATIYRWKNEDKEFSKNMEKALAEGEALINDMSESQLITLIREKSFAAIRFWLNHRSPKFRDHVDITAKFEKHDELTPEQEKIVREALKLAEPSSVALSDKEK